MATSLKNRDDERKFGEMGEDPHPTYTILIGHTGI